MVTLSEILRWIVNRVSTAYRRTSAWLMRRDVLLLGSEKKFRALLESGPDAIVIVNWHGHVAIVNAAAEKLFHYDRDEIVGQNASILLPDRYRMAYREHQKHYLRDPHTRPLGGVPDLYGRRKDGTEFPVEISLSPLETNEGLLVTTVIRDITERKRGEERLRQLADHDSLTGLRNRRSFEEHLSREVAIAGRYGMHGAVLLIDIDGLKDVNDTLGHAFGDEFLRTAGVLVSGRLRSTDIVARVGGDEFGVLMPHADVVTAQEVAEDLLRTLRDHPVALGAQRVRLSASIGVATYGAVDMGGPEVMMEADLALYQAKDAGRGRVAVYEPRPEQEAENRTRVSWAKRIGDALDEGRLVPYRQPIMSLPDNEIHLYELLVRMIGEDGHPTPPGAFLPTAERTGMVRDIDLLMVTRAIDLVASEPHGTTVAYSVNLSSASLADPMLPGAIAARLSQTGIDPAKLVFEITETAAVANMQQACEFAASLRGMGCGVALDDFGAGFASFYYLKHLPLDWLKIDGDFIRELPRNPTDQLVARHMIEIAHELGLRTIAEFVEDQETLDILAGYGVDCVQGFHIGHPEPIPESEQASRPLELEDPHEGFPDSRGRQLPIADR